MHKYEEVCKYITNYIQDNGLQGNAKLPTEKELMDKLQVSRITVQKALSELIAKGTIYRIQGSGTFVKQSQSAPASEVKTIPIVVSHDGLTTRTIDMMRGAEAFFETVSYYITTHNTNFSEIREKQIISRLIADGFHSMIVLPINSITNADYFFQLSCNPNLNLVFLDHVANCISTNYVESDNIMGGYLATRHLLDTGHSKIALISPQPLSLFSSFEQRLIGYKNALQHQGLPFCSDYCRECTQEESLRSIIEELLALPHPPDAIFALNDLAAIDIQNILTDLGKRIPEDIAIVGFDNIDMLSKQNTPISSVDQDFYSIGYYAAALLYDIMEHKDKPLTSYKLPVRLVRRI